jgi:hypothetical protein
LYIRVLWERLQPRRVRYGDTLRVLRRRSISAPIQLAGARRVNRQTRNTWILASVVAILGLAAVAEQARDRMTAPKPLTALDRKTVNEIVLECPSCPRRRIERIQGAWWMAEPWVLPADAATVDRLLDVGSAPVRRRYKLKQLEPAKVGLEPAAATLTLGAQRLTFGTTDALTQMRYVRAGETISLVPDRFSHLLLAAPEAFVDPRPFAGLRNLSKITRDGRALPADRVAALATLSAGAVITATPRAGGGEIVAHYEGGRECAFTLTREGAGWVLIRREPSIAYALDDRQGAQFEFGPPPTD